MPSLDAQLAAALTSRDERLIRRRLPDPADQAASAPGTGAGPAIVDFATNDYLSLSRYPPLRSAFLAALQAAPPTEVLGSGGSRLLVNGAPHAALEARLARFFGSPAALLFNSGFDANVGFFSTVPQTGDVVVSDEHIHASVHDGVRSSRVARESRRTFAHNDIASLRNVLLGLLRERPGLARGDQGSVFLAVETLYSMDGTFAPLREMIDLVEDLFPRGNAHVVVDEAHATGIYGPDGRGLVAMLGLEQRVFARLHTFGKALAGTGAIMLVTPLVRDYLINYARSLIYTTSLSYANIIAMNCSFDMLENGAAAELANKLLDLSTYFLHILEPHLHTIPTDILSLPPQVARPSLATSLPFSSTPDALPTSTHASPTYLPSPIIPVMTAFPRPLSAHLRAQGLNARPITWPTVPKGADRVRVCLHAGNSRADVERLARAMAAWARGVAAERERAGAVGADGDEPGGAPAAAAMASSAAFEREMVGAARAAALLAKL